MMPATTEVRGQLPNSAVGQAWSVAFVRTICIGTICLGGLIPVAAGQSAPENASSLLQRGKQYFVDGYFEEASETLRQAASVVTSEVDAAQIQQYLGLSQHALGRTPEAAAAFRRALRWDATLELDAERFNPSVVSIFAEVKESLRGQLRMVGALAAGEVLLLDGAHIEFAPTLPVGIGPHRVEVMHDGGEPRAVFDGVVGVDEVVDIRLAPAASPSPDLSLSEDTDEPASVSFSSSSSSWPNHYRWGVGLLASAAVAAGAGIALGLSGLADHREWLDASPG